MMAIIIGFLFWGIILAWAYFWVVMFVSMMLFGPKDLPWEYDKAIWGVLFIALAPMAPFAFWMFKDAYRGAIESERLSKILKAKTS
ncbi:MAG: hypothetical protein JKY95_00535 [Planctomycetaceae bacterium]|nr:hypothetical protein [Planctomycetaceae bacterium]